MASRPASPTLEQNEQAYWDDFVLTATKFNCLPACENNPRAAASNTRVWYNSEEITGSPADVVQHAFEASRRSLSQENICIVENITPDYIQKLGSAWEIDSWFFVLFVLNRGFESDWATWGEDFEGGHHYRKAVKAARRSRPPWRPRNGTSSIASDRNEESGVFSMSADEESTFGTPVAGVSGRIPPPPFRVIRGEFLGPPAVEHHGWVERVRSVASVARSNSAGGAFYSKIRTSIAWYKLEYLTLFLVDSVPHAPNPLEPVRIKLQTVSTAHPGGHRRAHILCGPDDPLTSPRQLLLDYLDDVRTKAFRKLHDTGGGHTTDWVVTALAMYSWERALDSIKSDLYRLSFREVQNPDIKLNDRLHQVREDIWRLKSAVAETSASNPCWVTPKDDHGLREDQARVYEHVTVGQWAFLKDPTGPDRFYENILAEIQRLEDMLIQTFQILLSTISVQESQLGIQQSRRAALLTWLAFVYAPLSFLCGIFGMNVKEINGSPLSVWTVVVALVIVMLITLALFGAYKAWDRWKSRSMREKQPWSRTLFGRNNIEKDPAKLV